MQAAASSGTAEAGSSPGVVVERPAPGLARGKYAFPAWGIATLGGVVLAVALAYFLVRWRRR